MIVRLFAGIVLMLALPAWAGPVKTWPFRVYLDDTAIGHHHFELWQGDGEQVLRSRARFEVKLLRLPVYRYRHDAVERWRGDCLQSLESSTEDNGQPVSVRARAQGAVLELEIGDRRVLRHEPCAKSFAYWHPALLRATRLLNPQTGELMDVRITPAGIQPVQVGERTVPGWRYTLQGADLQIDLFYSEQGEWLALDAPTRHGRTLRYRLEQLPGCPPREVVCT